MRQENREHIDRLRENPMSEEDYNNAEYVLEALRKQRMKKADDEEKLSEIARARLLMLKRTGRMGEN